MRIRKLSSENFIDGVEIFDTKTVTAGTYNSLLANEAVIFCNTATGNIDISGLSGGVIGQKLTIVRNSNTNRLRLLHDNTSATQRIRVSGGSTLTVPNFTVMTLICDGTYWYTSTRS